MDKLDKSILETDQILKLEIKRITDAMTGKHGLKFKDKTALNFVVSLSIESIVNKTLMIFEMVEKRGESEVLNKDLAKDNIETTITFLTMTILALAGKPLVDAKPNAAIKAADIDGTIHDVVINVLEFALRG